VAAGQAGRTRVCAAVRAYSETVLRSFTAITWGRAPVPPLTGVQAVLGHRQLATTQIYLTPRAGGCDPPGAGPSRRAGTPGTVAGRAAVGGRVPS
jgi:hypothetical protein